MLEYCDWWVKLKNIVKSCILLERMVFLFNISVVIDFGKLG